MKVSYSLCDSNVPIPIVRGNTKLHKSSTSNFNSIVSTSQLLMHLVSKKLDKYVDTKGKFYSQPFYPNRPPIIKKSAATRLTSNSIIKASHKIMFSTKQLTKSDVKR